MSSREKSLAKNTLILTIGKISTQAISFFLLPLYTAYLSREDYGVVDLLSTLITLLLPILSLQMEQAIFRYMAENRKNQSKLQDIISTSFTFIFVQIVIYTCIFCIVQLFIQNQYKWFLLSNLVAAVINFSLMQVLRGLGDNIGYAIAAFISSVVTILANVFLIVGCHWGATAMLTAAFTGNVSSIVYIFFRTKIWRYYNIRRFSRYVLKDFLSYCIPLVPNELSWWAIRASDRFVISTILGTAMNGLVAVAQKFPNIFIMIYNIFGIAWNESIILHLKDDDGGVYFSNLVNKMLRIFSSVALLIIVFMPYVFKIMVNSRFQDSYGLIPLYMLGAVLNVLIGLVSAVYIVYKQTKVIAKTSFISAVICLLSNLILVNFLGIYASPISSIIGFGIMAIYRVCDIKRFVLVKWNHNYIISFCVVFLLILIPYYLDLSLLKLIAIIIAIVFVCLTNRDDLKFIYTYCKSKCKSIF